MPIRKILARQIYDSRGNPTVEVDLTTEKGIFRASVPSGASTGIHEALELRDKEEDWHGKGVIKAVNNINNVLAPAILAKCLDPTEQETADEMMLELDGTESKSKLGANAILAVSMAVCKAGAAHSGVPLYRHIAHLAGQEDLVMPVPCLNLINGGSHAGNELAMQEFMVLPTGAESFSAGMKMGSELYHHLKTLIKEKYGLDATAVGDEGGFAPNFQDNKEALDLLVEAIQKAGFEGKMKIGRYYMKSSSFIIIIRLISAMDVAASEFHKNGKYDLDFKNPETSEDDWISSDDLLEMYKVEVPQISNHRNDFARDSWRTIRWSHWRTLLTRTTGRPTAS